MSQVFWAEPLLFPQAAWWQAWQQANRPALAAQAPFPKRGWYHRFRMPGPEGWQCFSLPLKNKRQGTPYSALFVDWSQPRCNDFLMAVRSNYGKSPYFEWFFEELENLWSLKTERLLDLNQSLLRWTAGRMGFPQPVWDHSPLNQDDRLSITAFNTKLEPYPQPFQHKLGFMPQACALDLVFNLGPDAAAHLHL